MLWTPDSNAYEALGYRLTFVRSEVSATDSNSLMSDGRVHIVYKYVEGISRLKQKSKGPRPPARSFGVKKCHFPSLLVARVICIFRISNY